MGRAREAESGTGNEAEGGVALGAIAVQDRVRDCNPSGTY